MNKAESFLGRIRDLTISVFEYVILVQVILGCVASVLIGLVSALSPYGSGLIALATIIAGVITSLAIGGAAFLIVGIYRNTSVMAGKRSSVGGSAINKVDFLKAYQTLNKFDLIGGATSTKLQAAAHTNAFSNVPYSESSVLQYYNGVSLQEAEGHLHWLAAHGFLEADEAQSIQNSLSKKLEANQPT
jgi:hypothetical protein